MGNPNWCTPPDFFAALNAQFDFTLDAAASHKNALCNLYCTSNGTFGPGLYDDPRDGLSFPWSGHRVFCNPPYDANIIKWVRKASEASQAVLLLPPSIDTEWFHSLCLTDLYEKEEITIWGHDWLRLYPVPDQNLVPPIPAIVLYFMRGRLRFWRDGKVGPAPRAGNLLVVIRNDLS